MEGITIESIYTMIEKIDIRMETAEQNISFLLNLNDEKVTASNVIQHPVTTQPAIGVMVNHDGSKYQFTIPKFQLPGDLSVYLSEQAATDPEIIERILKIEGQGIIKLIY